MIGRWVAAGAAVLLVGGAGMTMVLAAAMGGVAVQTAAAMACDTDTAATGGDTTTHLPGQVGGDLADDQRANATTIIETGVQLGVPERGLIVAIATSLQESSLKNLNWGDRDSLGLFQQRAAWGPAADRTDPARSARMFYTGGQQGQPGLLDITRKRGWPMDWQDMTIGRAAQAVQVSAFPDAYAKWESQATAIVHSAEGGIEVTGSPTAPATPAATPPGCDDTADPAATGPATTGPCRSQGNLRQYGNGRIPDSALCALPFAPGHRLRGDAANAAIRLSAAVQHQFGHPLCVTDSYRSYAAQVDVFARKPGLAAVPGTSNHGWGTALDLCAPGGGQFVPGSTWDAWMHTHAATYGWRHPAWAEPSGSKPEPWHWEFTS